MSGDMRVELVTAPERLVELRPQWNALLQSSAADTLFLTWEWVNAWVGCFLEDDDRELSILVLTKDDKIIGIAPFYIAVVPKGPLGLREVRLLGYPQAGSDYLDVFAERGRERSVADAVYDFLFGEGRSLWDRLALSDIRAESLFLLYFTNRLDEAGKYFTVELSAYCPTFRLPRRGEDFLAGLSSNRREQFRRHRRVLGREPGLVRTRHSTRQSPEALERFFELYARATPYEGERLHALLARFVEDLPFDGDVQIDAAESDGRWVAGLLHMRYRDTLYMYLMAIDKGFLPKISIGNVLVGESIEAAIEDGLLTYDFLKGAEDYKFHWANNNARTLRLSLSNRRPLPLLGMWTELLKSAVKSVIR